MGYSARYHAASLIAVFLALAIGILIGAEFGGDALTNTRKDLEQSLVGNLQDARSRADDLNGELGRANEFAERVYPVLVARRLDGQTGRPDRARRPAGEVSGAVEEALGPTGAQLVGVGVVREPVDIRGLAADPRRRASPTSPTPRAARPTSAGVGRQLVLGGTLLEVVRGHLFSRQRQLRRPRRGDRRPRPARRHGPGRAARGRPVRVGRC